MLSLKISANHIIGDERSMIFAKKVENKHELQEAFAVRKKVFVEEQAVPEELELDDYDATASHFIVIDGQAVIGAARLREIDSQTGKVERVCILNSYRGQNLGVLIMNELEAFAKQLGLKKLKLNAQTYAIPFYEKLQYIVTSDEFMDAGIPHRSMEKYI